MKSATGAGAVSALLATIEENTKIFLDHLTAQGLPEPSFEAGDGLQLGQELPDEVSQARQLAIEAADVLHHLLLGPLGMILEAPGDQYLLLGLQYIYRYRIVYHVPVDGETTFEKIAEECNLNVTDVMRFLRCAIARNVLAEPKKGFVVHTAASRALINNPMLEAWILNVAEEFWPSVTRMVDATEQWPGSEEPNESGYSLSHNTSENPFDIIKMDPKRQQQFVDAMSFSHIHPSYGLNHLVDNFDFGSGTIVDIGGSHGQVSVAIAQKFPHVRCIVQDLPDTIAGLRDMVPQELNGRVLGMKHDFLTLQPVEGADIYLLRWILHDWSDKYCIKILQNLIPALRKGTKIVINDICIPEPGQLGPRADRGLRLMDISMKAFNNARERDAETWISLFKRADDRFIFKDMIVPAESPMAIMVAEWAG